MANVYAVSAGVWSNPARWNTGSLPTAADDVYSNGFNVTIDQDVTVLSLRNQSATGIAAGGTFVLQSNRTVNANIFAATTTCVTFTAGGTSTINGNITGGTGSNTHGISFSSGTLIFNGDATGGSGATTASGIAVSTAGTLTMIGNAYGGAGGATSAGVYILTSTSTATITGNVFGSANAVGVYMIASSTLTLNGDTTGGSSSSIFGMHVNGTSATVTINGNAIGGTGAASDGVRNTLAGTVIITGTVQGNTGAGARNDVGGTMRVTAAKGSDTGTVAGLQGITSTGVTTYECTEDGANGTEATFGFCKMKPAATNTMTIKMEDGSTVIMVVTDQVANGQPAQSDVRSGVVFDFGNKTGTCAVPLASQVVAGVAVDNTVGTAMLTAAQVKAAILDADVSTLTVSNSIGERLKNCSTVETTGAQITSLNP